MLANASMDIALHDVTNYFINSPILLSTNLLLMSKDVSFNDYIEQFWVGLLEGDGCIIVRRNKQNKVYGGFEISLKYLVKNEEMLKLFSKHIGGRIYYEKKNKQIIKVKWIALSTKDVAKCLNILSKYPLLTSRKICALEHLLKCLENTDWNYHLKTRDTKYNLQSNLINFYNNSFVLPDYFKGWLSGFIEAEGCFRFRNDKAISFYISQNNDLYILNAIKNYFNSNHKVGIHKDLRSVQLYYRI